jgi:hypothetical protein
MPQLKKKGCLEMKKLLSERITDIIKEIGQAAGSFPRLK